MVVEIKIGLNYLKICLLLSLFLVVLDLVRGIKYIELLLCLRKLV